jgi:hypothetical protein
LPPKPAPRPKAPVLPNCPECGTVAAEPRLRYCENCGAKMPEYKSPTLMELAAAGEGQEGELDAAPKKPPYTGPKWLEHVPGHSPTVLGVALHWVALGLSIIPALASIGPFWSFVMLMGSLLVVARELRAAGEGGPLVDWVPESAQGPMVPALYTALAVGLALPMIEFSIQPLLWLGGTVLVVRDQRPKVFAEPKGYLRLFDPRSLVRGHRIMALVGVGLCLLALLLPWIEINIGKGNSAVSAVAGVRTEDVPRMFDSVYNGMEDIRTAGIDRPVASTVLVALLTMLVLAMLRPEVDRPEWLRFVPAGLTVICVAWGLMNMKFKIGPIMFIAGLVPVGLVAFMAAMGRDELAPAYADEPPPEGDYADDGAPYEDDAPPPSDDDGRG